MAEHEIVSRIPTIEVLNTDVEFDVRSDGKLLGRLLVSRGQLEWKRRYARRPHVIYWEEFDTYARTLRTKS